MANYSTSANVVLSINGKQAQQMLNTLQKQAQQLETKLARAATAGDKASMKKLQKELTSTNRLIQQLQGSAATVEQTLTRLDKATPRDLQKTLRTLTTQLNGIQRGTAAWDAHTAKIRAVKAELQKVNATLVTQKSLWERMNMWLNNCQTAILGIGAAITGLVMAGRKAVNAYAEMDEQLANTRKYTGMTEEQVIKLNEAFKAMDTRIPRDKLNELAQEAGRLGKNTMESVQGYVEAAAIINVALCDLGEGATQTIAKLTNIFGVEEMLGTKEAMLAVGSTVNVLSQNCTASKPYLVEFAQRMAGIGSQAGLTIPQILAFGAVLDANGQKVEMSATAIQKVIMKLAQKNREFAATVGLDAEVLNETLKHSAKDGLMMFLQALHEIGESSDYDNATMILAPALKEMGLDAARVSQVLSTLAKHIDEVKWQMGEADKAFSEATSATKEYTIFNNTAQASIDKAKKRVTELAIELGQKLYPVMKHIYTSSGIFLRVLNQIVSFIIQHKTAIVTLTVSIIAYKVAVNAATIATRLHYTWLVVTQKGMQLLQAGAILLRMAFYALTGQITKAKNAWAAFNLLTKVTPWGIIAAAVAALVVWLVKLTRQLNAAQLAQKALNDIANDAATKLAEEKVQLDLLVKAAENEKLSLEERQRAIEKLNRIIPNYNAQLDATTRRYRANKQALDDYIESLRKQYEVEGAKEKLKEFGRQRADIEVQRIAINDEREENQRIISNAASYHPGTNISTTGTAPGFGGGFASTTGASQRIAQLDAEERALDRKLANIQHVEDAIMNKYGDAMQAAAATAPDIEDPSAPTYGGAGAGAGDGAGAGSDADRFAAEQAWKERQEAVNRIAYATGQRDYVEYTKEMDAILVGYYKKLLERTDLSEDERLSIQADYYEALKKQQERFTSLSIEAENDSYNERLAALKQSYIDGQISRDTYDLKAEELEIEHQRTLVNITKEGTKERLEAEKALQSLLIAQVQRRQREVEALEAKYAKMKEEYFGDNPQEAQAKYDADLQVLDVVYQRELAAAGDNAAEKLRIEQAYEAAKLALQKKYGLLAEKDNRNRVQRMTDDIVDWLNSDGGKAVTGTIDTLVSGMSSIFSQLSSLMQAELEIQTASINKRYDAEISRAEGNSYLVAKLEKEKEAEIAKAKNEANRKMFAMQVIQAVAQTAQNAISAYGSAAAIPVVGYILAPIAAAMAVAAGALQIAAIKKQQQASEAQGYAEGGFTPDGDKDTAVGVVHAGEWVASQRLVKNARVRPLLEALDRAQRNNTVGSLTPQAVSALMPPSAASVSSNTTAIRQLPSQSYTVKADPAETSASASDPALVKSLDRLNSRLNEPFVTVNTVSGDHGIQAAQDEYDKLMKNKTPKSKR